MAIKKAKRGRPRKSTASKIKASAPAKRRGRPAKAKPVAKKVMATSPAQKKTARKLKVGDCSGKLTRSRLVGGYGLKKRKRKPRVARRGRPSKR